MHKRWQEKRDSIQANAGSTGTLASDSTPLYSSSMSPR